jgi:deoxyribodipyrimidine photo-lyase
LDHDPDGKFIRRYLPELRDLPVAALHEPWRLDTPPRDYPPPVVEHEQAAREARLRMTPYRQGEGFREEAKGVLRRLGSRDRQRDRGRRPASRTARRPADAAAAQLSLGLGDAPRDGRLY